MSEPNKTMSKDISINMVAGQTLKSIISASGNVLLNYPIPSGRKAVATIELIMLEEDV